MPQALCRSTLLVVVAPLMLPVAGSAALSADMTVSGTIAGYECGDNCYLTITSATAEELVGLCAAPECQAWNEVAEMPRDLVGRKVTVTVGVGMQFDAGGNAMGEMPAFEEIEFE